MSIPSISQSVQDSNRPDEATAQSVIDQRNSTTAQAYQRHYKPALTLATTNDDSIGDAFDKVSRGLKIDVDWASTSPGAALEAFVMQRAEGGEQESEDKTASKRWSLPVPLKNKPEFS